MMKSAVLRLVASLARVEVMVFLPALTLIAYWIGGQNGLLLAAFVVPTLVLVAALATKVVRGRQNSLVAQMDAILEDRQGLGRTTGCFVIQFDDPAGLIDRHGRSTQTEILACCNHRIRGAMRFGDVLTVLEDGSLAVMLAPVFRLDLETMVQIAARLQAVIQQPIELRSGAVRVTCSIGFCLGRRAPKPDGRSLLDAAQMAVDAAHRHGQGTIRAFSPEMAREKATRDALREEVERALAQGEIKAHFQPQLSTDTGEVSGMEALARWQHPKQGCLSPADFLPAIEASGLSGQLTQVMLTEALTALQSWDQAGLSVPTVAVNFSASELRDPQLPERLKWELDRFDLTADRLTIEVLETVVAEPGDDSIADNIAALAAIGCGVDLDDFGTGHASITSIRRFALRRLKIDRSFVSGVDHDSEQQKMVAAVLSLAERLGLETLAEGVETAAEHAMLAQLGCGHVQGYAIARPMPASEVVDWLERVEEGTPLPLLAGGRTR